MFEQDRGSFPLGSCVYRMAGVLQNQSIRIFLLISVRGVLFLVAAADCGGGCWSRFWIILCRETVVSAKGFLLAVNWMAVNWMNDMIICNRFKHSDCFFFAFTFQKNG